jgi:penicillin-binding protein 1A
MSTEKKQPSKNPLANLFKKKDGSKQSDRTTFNQRTRRILNVLLWLGMFSPALAVFILINKQSDDEMPSIEMLENPPELLASVVYADDGKTELGRYWSVNRTSVKYKDISPFVYDALIATEDERFLEHAGIDLWAVARAIRGMGRDGGGSTITQQLAKLLFTLRQREIDAELRAQGKEVKSGSGLMHRLNEKAKENIIATRLEKRYTKEEIITMYLNQFDFLYNAVGVENAAKVYFSKKPSELKMEEAAVLVGMCKNPGLYNPHTYQVKDYRSRIAADKGISPLSVKQADIDAARSKDSTRAMNRRNTVLNQWLKSSKAKNPAVKNYITEAQCDSLKKLPIVINYQVVDHKDGIAPHFRESLRSELKALFNQKEGKKYKYRKKDGSKYDLYEDGLRIYTTINVNMQEHAEYAMARHLKEDLQPAFTKNNASQKNYPFSNTYNGKKISEETINNILRRARKNSSRYDNMVKAGAKESEIFASFDVPAPMRVFSWEGDFDTIMTPNDSIRYYKNIIRSGLLSIEPATGFVKAWVGGVDFHHFAFDHVKQGKRQVGSTMKPFVYATAMEMGVVKPCTPLSPEAYCVDPCDPDGKRWCPRGTPAETVQAGLAMSSNPTTVAVMSKMGACSGPSSIAKILGRMNISIPDDQVVPSMCLGTPDMSLLEMVGAQAMFVNNGIYIAPQTVIRIEDRNGNVIYSADPYSREVMSPSIAHETLRMMKGVVTSGTSTSLRWHQKWGGITHPTAGKTGTTQGNSDCWFMGLTPDLVTGVWTGGEDKQVRFRSMTWGQGARAALPIYGYYMQKVYADPTLQVSTEDFEQPVGYDPELFSCDDDIDPGMDPFGI